MFPHDIKCSGRGCPLQDTCKRTVPVHNQIVTRQRYILPPYTEENSCNIYLERATP